MSARAVRILSPAKINLFLDVVARRADGFHEIKTLFQAVNLCDELRLCHAARGIRVSCDMPDLPTGPENLVTKAASMFLAHNKIRGGVDIAIRKKIPLSGGLGGGSSNAACTLLALNKLFGRPCGDGNLVAMAEKLGSDVAFFLRGRPSLGIGKGNEIIELRSSFPFWLVLAGPTATPPKQKTASVYAGLKIGLTNVARPITITLAALETKSVKQLASSLFNRLEDVVFLSLHEAKTIKKFMQNNGAIGALVSGAGPTVFGIVSSRAAGVELVGKIRRRFGPRAWAGVVRTLAGTPEVDFIPS